MPNKGNRSNGNSSPGRGQTGDALKKASAPKPNPERSDKKHGSPDRNDTSRTSNQGRKRASGGS